MRLEKWRLGSARKILRLAQKDFSSPVKKLYVEVRKKDGSFYQRTSVRGLRAGIHRYIREPPFSRTDLSLFRDNSAFDEANDVLDAHLRVLKKQGELKATDHFPPISQPDLEKIGEFLRSSITEPMDPTDLTLAGWFVLTFHLGLRGREMQLDLRKQDLAISTDGEGKQYAHLSTSFSQKNHSGDLSSLSDDVSTGRVQDEIQVEIVKRLISLGHPKVDRLFQRANVHRKKQDDPYFVAAPLGKDSIGKFMSKISEKANLSRRYTNHSVRASCLTVLQSENVGDRHIASVTMHRNISSLVSYGRPSDRQNPTWPEPWTNLSSDQKQALQAITFVPTSRSNLKNSSLPVPKTNLVLRHHSTSKRAWKTKTNRLLLPNQLLQCPSEATLPFKDVPSTFPTSDFLELLH